MAELNPVVPNLVNARGALEHFDEYAIGRSHLQRSAPEQYLFWFSVEGGEPIVRLGRFWLSVRLAREACRRLVFRLLAAAWREQPAGAEAHALLGVILAGPGSEQAGTAASRSPPGPDLRLQQARLFASFISPRACAMYMCERMPLPGSDSG